MPGLTFVSELHYLPSLAFFTAIRDASVLMAERWEHFEKQSYRNRCYINTPHGTTTMVIPLTGKHGKTRIHEVRIDYSQKWLNNHWRTICSAYGKAPFFEYYAHDLHEVLTRRHVFLYELNLELLTLCLRWLRCEIEIRETLSYQTEYPADIYDIRNRIHPKDTAYIKRIYKPVPYHQVFGNSFADNLSIVDLVFCCGPEASRILRESLKRD